MKSFLLIGMGSFGHHLCLSMAKQRDVEMMIVDKSSDVLEDLLPYVVSAKVGDCCDEKVLRSFGVDEFDACYVCIGGDFQNSIQITSLLKDLGARKVIAKADEDVQAKFLLRNGADQVIYPERDIAERIAITAGSNRIFDFIELSEDLGVYEVRPMKKWIGKTIREVNVRVNYNVSILAYRKDGKLVPMPSPDYVFVEDEHLMVISSKSDIDAITR
ncbi:MAG: TrkA family potassium uptake protein [Clostridia bacterium]|jgi:trk system potassium uptake protein TrkA|nr:TrkA family potassium uptake protein [Clostridia bacterium]MBO7398215.1 TrkA family potassium uptake protein [Clostridia bacterium]MBO7657974.1 TrkA family potassium uptake protein [Clostridia bacterium]MBP5665148.1 TrkA family potassium uptake protein [Clostridia bacterium]MBP5765705.1 TrkA family potassium uptake protein [Clostridia bacterium]